MADVAKAPVTSPTGAGLKAQNPNAIRETVESVIVAFILAFLFRAFVAEAFVIPTGSMAPTLMGAHKDTQCDHCGALYQSTASYEFDRENTNARSNSVAIGSTCALCRATNAFDLAGNSNHATFSGDRILVSKFDYLFRDPQRWDVLVFKYPTDARVNYIKRLVGLPGEKLHIEGGDVYIRKADNEPWELARKPPHKALAMMQVVSDTQHQARDLVARGWPSLWQPQPDAQGVATAGWKVEQVEQGWSAEVASSTDGDQPNWLRYYHKYLKQDDWEKSQASSATKLPGSDPYSINLITDFLAYNTTRFGPRGDIYNPNGYIRDDITSEQRALNIVAPYKIGFDGLTGLAQDGWHWVGDLAAEYDVEVKSASGVVSLDAVEFGIHYRCDIDIATGKATLSAVDQGKPLAAFAGEIGTEVVVPSASTSMRGAGRHRIRFANIDDQLMLWIDGSLVQFDKSTTFDSHKVRAAEARRPYWTPEDPLDAAPLAIGTIGAELKVHRAQVWRDIYYIAVRSNDYSDYDAGDLLSVLDRLKDSSTRLALRRDQEGAINVVSWVYSHPQLWSSTDLFAKRGSLDFTLEEGQFFPMGDNSAASSDARVWGSHSYVERRFLIGKALLVFWPHMWSAPVPHPNFSRMGRIR